MSGRLPRPKGMQAVKTKQVATPYEPKPEERAAIAAYLTWKRGSGVDRNQGRRDHRRIVMGKNPLNHRQQRFVDEFIVDLNATQAAIRAGYAENSAHVTGCRLLSNDKVSEAIAAGKAELAERAGVSQDWVIERLKEVREASMRESDKGMPHNPAAANRSLELIGKHGGMWTEGHTVGDINIQVNVHPHGHGKDD